MTAESARAFWAKVKQDQDFRGRLAAATSDEELDRLIRDAGFAFTAEELQIGLAQWKANSAEGKELPETELEKVAGGSVGSSRIGLQLLRSGLSQLQANLNFRFKG